MQPKIAVLLCLISLSLALESRAHNYYYNTPYGYKTSTQTSSSGGAAVGFIIIVGMLVIGCSYFFCCRGFFNRNPNQFSQNRNNPPYNPNYNPGPPFRNPPYAPPPPQYQQSFRQPVQGAIPNPNRASNPYVTGATDRLSQPCDMCSIKNKIGE